MLQGAMKAVAAAGAAACAATVAQVAIVALTTPRLPPAPGPTHGRTPAPLPATPGADPLRVLVFGDSVAAGVGCPSNDQAFAGSAARGIAQVSGRPVEWSVVAQSGFTAADMHTKLLPRLRKRFEGGGVGSAVDVTERFDVCLISVGVNHVLSAHSPSTYQRELRDLLKELRAVLGEGCALVVLGMPPMGEFPAIAAHFPLSWVVHWYSRALHKATESACEDLAVLFDIPNLEKAFSQSTLGLALAGNQAEFARQCMAPDGFHPSATAIGLIAEEMAACCLNELGCRSKPSPNRVLNA